jgi:hypothetical protein
MAVRAEAFEFSLVLILLCNSLEVSNVCSHLLTVLDKFIVDYFEGTG